jgi:cytochrome c oxidase subunit II
MGSDHGPEDVDYGRTVRRPPGAWRLVAAATVAAVGVAGGCDLPGFGAPDPASKQGDSIHALWQGFFLAALAVAALVWGLLIFVILRYRRRRGDPDRMPSQNGYNIPIEIVYTVAPILIVAVLFGASVLTERKVNKIDDNAAATVDVIGFQWSWQFHYQGEGVTITGVPGRGPELVLPVGQPSHLRLISADVNHSFWVPDFLSKRDLIPGVDNEIEVTPTKTGSYVGRCAEYCGLDHWRMNYSVRVVSWSDYKAWLAKAKADQGDQLPLKVVIDDGNDTAGGSTGNGS